MERPSTSRARGVCRYFRSRRGCREANCKFLHDHPTLTPYDCNKTCRFYAAGFCSRGSSCWFKHVYPDDTPLAAEPSAEHGADSDDDDHSCSICYEKPSTFGLLIGCGHAFCLRCLRDWRDPHGKSPELVSSQSIKKCPLCREPSRYIVPSSIFLQHGSSEKTKAVDKYRASMARVPCKYFQPGSRRPHCPFGDDCFYRHLDTNGSVHMFGFGVDNSRRAQFHSTSDERIATFEQFLEESAGFFNVTGRAEAAAQMGEDDMDAISFALERFRTASMASVSAIDPHGTELRDVAAADLRNLAAEFVLRFHHQVPTRAAEDGFASDSDTIHPSDSASQNGGPSDETAPSQASWGMYMPTAEDVGMQAAPRGRGSSLAPVETGSGPVHAPQSVPGIGRARRNFRVLHRPLVDEYADMPPLEDIFDPDSGDQFDDMPTLEEISSDSDSDSYVSAPGPSMPDEQLAAEVSQVLHEADGISQRATAVLQDSQDTEIPTLDDEVARQSNELLGPAPDTGVDVPAAIALTDEWEAQQVPFPPFTTDGQGKVVYADPEVAHDYSDSRRRRHGRI